MVWINSINKNSFVDSVFNMQIQSATTTLR